MTPNSKLEGILKWSLAHSDGTGPARQISEEERQWFKEAVESSVVDVVGRMKEITLLMGIGEEGLLRQGITVEEITGMLEELQEHVESIDMANDLKAIGGLEPLLKLLKSPDAAIRAHAAEVVTTMVQNNEKSQQSVMDAGGMLALCEVFLNDKDTVARTKALGAISSLARHNLEGLSTFRTVCGVPSLLQALTLNDVRLSRKVLHMFVYLLQQHPEDNATAQQHAVFPLVGKLLESADYDTRQAACELLSGVLPSTGSSQERADLRALIEKRLGALQGESEEDAAEEKAGLQRLRALSLTSADPAIPRQQSGGAIMIRPS